MLSFTRNPEDVKRIIIACKKDFKNHHLRWLAKIINFGKFESSIYPMIIITQEKPDIASRTEMICVALGIENPSRVIEEAICEFTGDIYQENEIPKEEFYYDE